MTGTVGDIDLVSPPSRDLRYCPACADTRPVRVLGVQGGFAWGVCRTCGCHFVNRHPSADELADLYGSYYDCGNLTAPEFVRRRLREILDGFIRYKKLGRLLDVGFGAGTLLSVASEIGWECWGQEVSATAAEHGREMGWEVINGDLLTSNLPKESFDVVCIVEVLEHLEEPKRYIEYLYSLLRPGGLLYATTPNAASLNSKALGVRWSVYSAPEHLQLFTVSSLGGLLRRSGFQVQAILAEGLNASEIQSSAFAKHRSLPVDRVQTSYSLNERFSTGRGRRLIKRTANRILSSTRLGDSLKVFAVRPDGD